MTITSPRHEFDYVEDKSCFRTQVNSRSSTTFSNTCSCLCGTGSCRFCCRSCPPAKESTLTRVVYIVFLVVIILIMAMFMSDYIQKEIMKIFPDNNSVCKSLGAGLNCHAGKLMGYLIVYRIGFAVTLYHLILMLSTVGVKSSKDCRAAFHNGLWIYKFMLLVVLLLLAFFIPDPRGYFISGWMYIAMIGAAGFIVIQLLLIVFMVHKWTDKIQEKVNKGESAIVWYSVLSPAFATFVFILSGAGTGLLFIYFAGEGCFRNQWFIMINAVGCIIVSFVAGIKRDLKPVGLRLLHASLISLYVTYLTWMAITSAPRKFQKLERPNYITVQNGRDGTRRFSANVMSFQQEFYCGPNGDEEMWVDKIIPYISFVITILTVVYGSIGISEPEQCRALALPGCPVEQDKVNHEIEDVGGQIIIRNERKSLKYSYSLFHLMITLACLLMLMHLTEWHTPTQASFMTFGRSWSTVWIKISSSWVCLLIYFVTILCPSILPLAKEIQVSPAPLVVEMNGHAFDSDDGIDAESFDEEAVPLKRITLPPIPPHLETTV